MRKVLLLIVLVFVFISPVFAEKQEKDESGLIPARMEPYSVIEYTDNKSFVVQEGGYSNDLTEYSNLGIPAPVKGTIVTYASDGFIQDIIMPDGVENPLKIEQSFTLKSETDNLRYVVPEGHTLVATWGAHNNALYQSSSLGTRIGWGRGTTFSDTIGQANITNYKGSVATKLAYDNVAVNTTVYVKTQTASGSTLTKAMVKTDAGSMPDAIIDIWKTGVEYWGYTWSNSFSMPNTIEINHAY